MQNILEVNGSKNQEPEPSNSDQNYKIDDHLQKDFKVKKSEYDHLGKVEGSHKVKNEIKGMINFQYTKVSKRKDKKDYSTVEKVLDPRTEKQLEKWRVIGLYSQINGCISTGKEANVYFAEAGEVYNKHVAIKIYKVDTMVFRDREEYIDGEHRFRKG